MKFTVTLFALLFAFSLSAQYQRGNWYLDGQAGAAIEQGVGQGSDEMFVAGIYAPHTGYFFTDRLLVGSQVSFTRLYSERSSVTIDTRLQLNPFLRYYFPGGSERKVSFFGEAGFGTFTFFGHSNELFETDFHFGAGAELPLSAGVLGTASLRYNANALGLNFTTLDFGLNVLTGQLENASSAISLKQGTLTADAAIGSISYGRMSRNGMADQQTNISFTPRIGYFLTDRLLIEGNLATEIQSNRDFINFNSTDFQERTFNVTHLKLGLDVRYYLKQNGLLLPYVTAGIDYANTRKHLEVKGSGNEISQQKSTTFWRAGAGFSYFLSPNLALDTEFRFGKNNLQLDEYRSASDEGFNKLQLKTGFKFFLPR